MVFTIPEITIETEKHIIYPEQGKIWNKRMRRFTGCLRKDGYLIFDLGGFLQLNHRYIFEKFYNVKLKKEEQINHINNIRDDNRIDNLEVVNQQQNNQWVNKRTSNSSGFKGVSWDKRDSKWISQIHLNKKHIYLGRFTDIRDAANSYNLKAIELNENSNAHFKLIPLINIIHYKKKIF